MRQEVFERSRSARWDGIESLLRALEQGASEQADEFPSLYRSLCQDLALSRERGFSASLVEKLNGLALRGHEQLYGAERSRLRPMLEAALASVPGAVRAHRGMLIFVSILFVVGAAATFWHCYRDESFIYSVLDSRSVASYESMYGPDRYGTDGLRSDSSALAFGFYIQHNITIDFWTFASGVLLGIGSLFVLVYNAVLLGAVAGHLYQRGYGEALGTFVVGHGAFEIPALIVCAAAGMTLGLAWVAPGRRSRLASLRHAAQGALPLVAVGGAMGVVAAALEAFWSPLDLTADIKYAVGGALWASVLGAFVLLGQARAD